MHIEVLYLKGCPNHRPAVERLRKVLEQEGWPAEILEIEVRDQSEAERLKFPGSPTIRINGQDIEVAARSGATIGLACRRYPGGLPPEEMIRRALREERGGIAL
jgi:hypothetical protein